MGKAKSDKSDKAAPRRQKAAVAKLRAIAPYSERAVLKPTRWTAALVVAGWAAAWTFARYHTTRPIWWTAKAFVPCAITGNLGASASGQIGSWFSSIAGTILFVWLSLAPKCVDDSDCATLYTVTVMVAVAITLSTHSTLLVLYGVVLPYLRPSPDKPLNHVDRLVSTYFFGGAPIKYPFSDVLVSVWGELQETQTTLVWCEKLVGVSFNGSDNRVPVAAAGYEDDEGQMKWIRCSREEAQSHAATRGLKFVELTPQMATKLTRADGAGIWADRFSSIFAKSKE